MYTLVHFLSRESSTAEPACKPELSAIHCFLATLQVGHTLSTLFGLSILRRFLLFIRNRNSNQNLGMARLRGSILSSFLKLRNIAAIKS